MQNQSQIRAGENRFLWNRINKQDFVKKIVANTAENEKAAGDNPISTKELQDALDKTLKEHKNNVIFHTHEEWQAFAAQLSQRVERNQNITPAEIEAIKNLALQEWEQESQEAIQEIPKSEPLSEDELKNAVGFSAMKELSTGDWRKVEAAENDHPAHEEFKDNKHLAHRFLKAGERYQEDNPSYQPIRETIEEQKKALSVLGISLSESKFRTAIENLINAYVLEHHNEDGEFENIVKEMEDIADEEPGRFNFGNFFKLFGENDYKKVKAISEALSKVQDQMNASVSGMPVDISEELKAKIPELVQKIQPDLIVDGELQPTIIQYTLAGNNLASELKKMVIMDKWQAMEPQLDSLAHDLGSSLTKEDKIKFLQDISQKDVGKFEVGESTKELVNLLKNDDELTSFMKDPAIKREAIIALSPELFGGEKLDLVALIKPENTKPILDKVNLLKEASGNLVEKAKTIRDQMRRVKFMPSVLPEDTDFKTIVISHVTVENVDDIVNSPREHLQILILKSIGNKIKEVLGLEESVELPDSLDVLSTNIDRINSNYKTLDKDLQPAVQKINTKLGDLGTHLPENFESSLAKGLTAKNISTVLQQPDQLTTVVLSSLAKKFADFPHVEKTETIGDLTKVTEALEKAKKDLDQFIINTLTEGIELESGRVIKAQEGYDLKSKPEKVAAIRKKLLPCIAEFISQKHNGKLNILGEKGELNVEALGKVMRDPNLKGIFIGEIKVGSDLHKEMGEYMFDNKNQSPSLDKMQAELMDCFDMTTMGKDVFDELAKSWENGGSFWEKLVGVFSVFSKYIGMFTNWITAKFRSAVKSMGPAFEKMSDALGKHSPDSLKKVAETSRTTRYQLVTKFFELGGDKYKELFSLKKIPVADILRANPEEIEKFKTDNGIEGLSVAQIKNLQRKLLAKEKGGQITDEEKGESLLPFLVRKFDDNDQYLI